MYIYNIFVGAEKALHLAINRFSEPIFSIDGIHRPLKFAA
jgi:hypothetical protein